MNLKIPSALWNATRLVRGGRLSEATAAIQRALSGNANAYAAQKRAHESAPLEGSFRTVEERGAPESGQFITRTYTNAFGTRAYKTYVPAAYQGQAMPLVVMLHGCKQAPDDFAAATRMNALAEEHGLVVVYPQQASRANVSKCWNWFQGEHQQRDAGEPSLIAGIAREVVASYGLDGHRVYVAGLSAGGAMAAIMGTVYPDVFAAVGIHSGLAYAAASDVTSAFAAMRGQKSRAPHKTAPEGIARNVPTIVFHGDGDTTVDASNGDELIARAGTAASMDADHAEGFSDYEPVVEQGETGGRRYTRTTFCDAAGRSVMEQWLVHGAAHAWCGGSAEGSFSDPAGPDASREMLRFFLQHQST